MLNAYVQGKRLNIITRPDENGVEEDEKTRYRTEKAVRQRAKEVRAAASRTTSVWRTTRDGEPLAKGDQSV